MFQPLLQDISFVFKEDVNHNYSVAISQLLHNYLIKQFRNSNNKLFKKYYSENFNLIHTLECKDINNVKTNYKFIFISSNHLNYVSVFHRLTRKYFTNIEMSEATCPVVCVDPNDEDDLYIGGYFCGFICHYRYNRLSSAFEYIKQFNGNFSWVTNIVIDKQLIYCSDRVQNKISILSKENGQLIREIKNEYTLEPWNIALFDKNYFFLTSLQFNSVLKLSLIDGTLIKCYEGIEGATGMIINDKTNHLIVCCYNVTKDLNKICVVDCKTLELIREIKDNFDEIISLDIDCDGNLYVSETGSSKIKIFN